MAASDSHKHSNLCYLLVEGGTKVSRTLLLKRINDLRPSDYDQETWTLDSFLESNKTKILDSKAGEDKKYILFPRAKKREIDKWDLSVFCLILLETCDFEEVLRMNLEQLRKLRNKILHLNTTAIDDNKYKHYFTKLTVILSNCLVEIGDVQLSEEINKLIEKSSRGSIPESGISNVMLALQSSHDETRQHLEKLGNFVEGNFKKFDKMIGMLIRLEERTGNTVAVPDAGVTIGIQNCPHDKVLELSHEMVEIFNEVVARDFNQFEDLSNDWKHNIKEAVYQTCVLFLSKGQPVDSAEEGCVLLNIKCMSIASLLSLFKDYIHGKLDHMLWILEAAITSKEGYEDTRLEAIIYKDEFWSILTKIVKELDTCVAEKEGNLPPSSPSNGKTIPSTFHKTVDTQARVSSETKHSHQDIRPGSLQYVKQLEMAPVKVDSDTDMLFDVQFVEAECLPASEIEATESGSTTGNQDAEIDDGTQFGTPKSGDIIKVVKPDEYPPGIVVTAAIDFGTSYSGYAYAFRTNPCKVFMSTWDSQTKGHPSEVVKAPTAVLFEHDGTFSAFGWEAEVKYSKLADGNKQKGWFFFKNFKMELYRNKKLSRGMAFKDIEGKEMPAVTVFSEVIKFLKDRILEEVRRTLSYLEMNDILWVLTVPAIWSDAAKQFMRVSATKAGIPDRKLKLVLEAEAASLYCQIGESQEAESTSDTKMFPEGLRYIVADLGGGTTDIASHEVLADGFLREIYSPTGESCGGDRINIAFNNFLERTFGEPDLKYFQRFATRDYLELVRGFELMKRSVRADTTYPLKLRCPAKFIKCLATSRKMTLDECKEEWKISSIIDVEKAELVLSKPLVESLFDDTILEISKILKETIRSVKNVQKVFLVGGFSASPYVIATLTKDLRKEFHGLDIIKPEESNLHVLKGAVLTSLQPNCITERVARFTYGFRVAEVFDENKHPDTLKDTRASGEVYCSDIFLKFIEVGQIMKHGDKVRFEFGGNRRHEQSKQEPCSTEIYRSPHPHPKFCTPEENCQRIGRIIHTPPKAGWGDVLNFTTEIRIGDTEFHVTVVDNETSKIYSDSIEFLED